MDSFKNYQKSLENLGPSAILGNDPSKKSKLPTSGTATSRASSLSKLTRTPRPKSRVRKLSETDISPQTQGSKASKMALSKDELQEMIDNAFAKNAKDLKDTKEEFKDMLSVGLDKQSIDLNEEQSKRMGMFETFLKDKLVEMKSDITEIKDRQKYQDDERVSISRQVDLLTGQVQTLTNRLDSAEAPDIEQLSERMSEKFSKQIQTTHFQNLAYNVSILASTLSSPSVINQLNYPVHTVLLSCPHSFIILSTNF